MMRFSAQISRWSDRLKRDPIGSVFVGLAADSVVYLTGGLLIGLGNVVLVPLYARCLVPREFGIYALVDVTVLLLVTVSALKLDVSYLKWFAHTESAQCEELLGSVLITGLIVSVLGGTALSVFVSSRTGEEWLHASAHNFAWLLLPIVVLENLQVLSLSDLRARRRPGFYSTVAVVRLAVLVICSYYLLAIRQMGLEGLFLGRLVGDGAACAALAAISARSVVIKIRPHLLRPMLAFGFPLVLTVFTVMLQDAAGRFFLNRYGTLAEVGLLGAAIKVGSVFQVLIAQPFSIAWGGVLFQIVKENKAQVIYSKIFNYVYVVACGGALVLAICAPLLFRVLTAPVYYSAARLLPFVLLVRAMSVIEQPAAVGIYLSGRTGLFPIIYAIALFLDVVMLRALVPRYGAMGVCWAWLVGSASVPLMIMIVGRRLYPLILNRKLLVIPLLVWLFVLFRPTIHGWYLPPSRLWLQVLESALVALGTVSLLIWDFRSEKRKSWSER